MLKLIAFRLLLTIPSLFIVGLLAFSLVYFVPGSAAVAVLGTGATPDEIARVEEQLGLNRPYLERLVEWFGAAVQGDLGHSFRLNAPVTDLLLTQLPATLSLVVGGLVVVLLWGIGIGLYAGLNAGKVQDRVASGIVALFQSIPEFWLGIILILIFVLHLAWFPVTSYYPFERDPLRWLHGIVLPSIALGLGASALIARQTRAGIASAMASLYVDGLRAAGVPRRLIIWRYALKNTMVPVLAATGLAAAMLIGSSLVMERVFGFPGIGTVLVSSVITKDFPLVQGGAVLIGALVIIINLFVDIGYGLLNPKARPQ